jgi:tetratricopeptide (TPR) repeat protein
MHWLLIAFVLACPSFASAQRQRQQQQQPEPQAEARPQGQDLMRQYQAKVGEAIRQAMATRHEEALATLEDAVSLDPSKPHAYYFRAEIERLRGNLQAAHTAFQECVRTAQNRDDAMHARCLQGIAETTERQEGALEQARQSWSQYSQLAQEQPDAASSALARARIQAIDTVTEQERVYVDVRRRIAERERAAGNTPRRPSP